MTESIRVIDNILPERTFVSLASNCMNSDGYYCHDSTTYHDEEDGSKSAFGADIGVTDVKFHQVLFNFNLFKRVGKQQTAHDLFYYLKSEGHIKTLWDALNVKTMIQMRLNCTTAADKNYQGGFHTDFYDDQPHIDKLKTAVLYLNSNNGGTQIQDGQFIQSVANRVVIFPTTQPHAGVWATNKKLRFVLNLNYLENG